MHLTEEQVQRVLHGEHLDEAARGHLASCDSCRGLVAEASADEREIFQLLESVDQPPPSLGAETLAGRARARRQSRLPRGYRWAAGLLLACFLGGVAYAIPGSPLRSWLDQLRKPDRVPPTRVEPTPVPAPPVPMAGVAVDPGRRLTVIFEAPFPGARARVWMTGDSMVTVQAPSGEARFTSATDRILVSVATGTTVVEVRIPRDAPRVDILVGTRRLLTKVGPRITAPVPAGSDTVYVLPLTP